MATIVSLERLQLARGRRLIGRPIDLTIEKGECVLVYGPNGSGKTTLCDVLEGSISPVSGIIRRYLRRRDLVRLPQETRLFTSLAVHEHLALVEASDTALGCWAAVSQLLTALTSKPSERISEVLAITGLAQRSHTAAGKLSTGERQRLKLAIVRLTSALLVVLDEPHAGLDQVSRAGLPGILKGLTDRGVAVLATAHAGEDLSLEGARELHLT